MNLFSRILMCSLLCLPPLLLSGADVYNEELGDEQESSSVVCSHSAGSWTVITEATCTSDGEEAASCALCGMEITQTIPQKGHSYGAWSVVREATAEQEGLEEGACSGCGATTTRSIPKVSQTEKPAQKPEQDAPAPQQNDIPASGIPSSGWVEQDGKRRYRLSAQKYATGWLKLEDGWYCFDGGGFLLSGWHRDEKSRLWYYLDENGLMATGWREVGGSCYFFTLSGRMLTGWFQDEDKSWYYFSPSGVRKSGWLQDQDGSWYYFAGDGKMKTGWFSDPNGEWYYFSPEGRMQTGWLQQGGRWYCLSRLDGKMLRSAYAPDGSRLDENGIWQPEKE